MLINKLTLLNSCIGLCISNLSFAEQEPLYRYYISDIANYTTIESDANSSGLYRVKNGCRIVTDTQMRYYRKNYMWDFDPSGLIKAKVTHIGLATYDYEPKDFQRLKNNHITLGKEINLNTKDAKVIQQFKFLQARFDPKEFEKCYKK